MAKKKSFNPSTEDISTFLGAIRLGLGVTHAASFIQAHPQDVSEMMRNDPEFMNECTGAIKYAVRLLMITANNQIEQEDFAKVGKTRAKLANFVGELVLWEDYCKLKDVTPDHICRAAHIYKTLGECATAVGMTSRELIEYIAANQDLARYFNINHLYGF